jgi:hypothetical protein
MVAVALLLLPFGYYATFSKLPSGLHFIRQADGLSFALNYAFHDTPFFTPENFNLFVEDGKAASEFPLIYKLASLTSNSSVGIAFSIRVLHALLFFGGIAFSVYSLLKKNASSLAIWGSHLIILLSTVVLYYSNNYLPDIAALGCTIAAMSLLFEHDVSPSHRENRIALIFFILASLFKITYAIYPLSWFFIGLLNRRQHIASFRNLSIWLVPVAAWWTYVTFYNKQIGNTYYSNRAIPIWETPADERAATWELILNYWRNSYLPELTQTLVLIAFVSLLFSLLTLRNQFVKLLLLSFAGLICYVLLFFQKFRDHDYYFLVFIPFVLHVLIVFFSNAQKYFSNKTGKVVVTAIILVAIISAFAYVQPKLLKRYSSENQLENVRETLTTQVATLNEQDIRHKWVGVVVGDSTINGTLHMFERKGYILPTIPNSNDLAYWSKIKDTCDFIVLIHAPDSLYRIDTEGRCSDYPCLLLQ